MAAQQASTIEGGCSCGTIRYRLERAPLYIHCCHCHACQRETGSAFALNAMIESDQVRLLPGVTGSAVPPKLSVVPSDSGKGQLLARCSACSVVVWSSYSGSGPYVQFVRVGTLDKHYPDGRDVGDAFKPDMYIFTKFKQPWYEIPAEAKREGRVAELYYNVREKWPQESLDRWTAKRSEMQAWKQHQHWKSPNDVYDASTVTDLRVLEKDCSERGTSRKRTDKL